MVSILTDEALLDRVQRDALRYFWEFAHPVSGMARDRSRGPDDLGDDAVVTGGTGMGVMAIVVGVERGWIPRSEAVAHLTKLIRFLLYTCDHFHGVLGHFVDGRTGRVLRFGRKDDAADLVETSFLVQGLLVAREYFRAPDRESHDLSVMIDQLWHDVEWDWHTRSGEAALTWHWSPNHGWALDHQIHGWNECLITYLLAASSPSYPVSPRVYHNGFARGGQHKNGGLYFDVTLPLGPAFGGPLFFTHYSFLGLDPNGLKDKYADYGEQVRAHTAINHAHCLANPGGFKGYGADCWGLTASDDDRGYAVHAPDEDTGVISPTAALSSFPYLPEASLKALRHFHDAEGGRLWGRFGPVDAFNDTTGWRAETHLAIDQGPIVVMIENGRSGLIWRLFMQCPEIKMGLQRLGFTGPTLV